MAATMTVAPAQTYYRYVDQHGSTVIVESLDKVPKALRAKAKAVTIAPQQKESTAGAPDNTGGLAEKVQTALAESQVAPAVSESLTTARVAAREVQETLVHPSSMHLPSFVLGICGTIIAILGARFVKGHRTLLVKIVLGLAALGLGGSAYLGFIRKSVGLSDTVLASPAQLLEEVQRAKTAVERDSAEKNALLDGLERDPAGAPPAR